MASFTTDIMNTVKTMVKTAIDKAPYDVTRHGAILAVNDDATCSVRIDGINYPNVPIYGGNKSGVNAGDTANILFPTNRASGMMIMPLASGRSLMAYILDPEE